MNAPEGFIITTIPFPGFYESTLSHLLDNEEEQLAEYLAGEGFHGDSQFPGKTASDIAEALYWCTSYGDAHRHIAREYAETFAHELNADAVRAGIQPFALEFESMDSPREYNFTTDRVFMRIPVADFERMRAACDPDTLSATIRETFRPRSGFIPFYSNDPAEWAEKAAEYFDHNEAGTVLTAFLQTLGEEDGYFDRIVDWTCGNYVFGAALDAALDMDALRARLAEETDDADA